ncbi:hypothetical protein RJT34_09763 [Clitoria ternatea]|uniref:RING-type E3 ubiquitin transferase n=1 Tax=Clitoria ternatea TaxID=43366 RepID=A0AAN9K7U1_CLITE
MLFFSWELEFPPLINFDLQNVLEEEHIGDYFNVKVNITYESTGASIETPIHTISFQASMFLPVQEFLENGVTYIRGLIREQTVQDELTSTMMPRVIACSQLEVQNSPPDSHYVSPNLRVFNLVLDILIQTIYEDDEYDDGTDTILSESISEVRMIPASKNAIARLRKVKLQECATLKDCAICLTEFDQDTEVLQMPCKHVYHEECLVQWLQTSHVCPLCRYPLSTLED